MSSHPYDINLRINYINYLLEFYQNPSYAFAEYKSLKSITHEFLHQLYIFQFKHRIELLYNEISISKKAVSNLQKELIYHKNKKRLEKVQYKCCELQMQLFDTLTEDFPSLHLTKHLVFKIIEYKSQVFNLFIKLNAILPFVRETYKLYAEFSNDVFFDYIKSNSLINDLKSFSSNKTPSISNDIKYSNDGVAYVIVSTIPGQVGKIIDGNVSMASICGKHKGNFIGSYINEYLPNCMNHYIKDIQRNYNEYEKSILDSLCKPFVLYLIHINGYLVPVQCNCVIQPDITNNHTCVFNISVIKSSKLNYPYYLILNSEDIICEKSSNSVYINNIVKGETNIHTLIPNFDDIVKEQNTNATKQKVIISIFSTITKYQADQQTTLQECTIEIDDFQYFNNNTSLCKVVKLIHTDSKSNLNLKMKKQNVSEFSILYNKEYNVYIRDYNDSESKGSRVSISSSIGKPTKKIEDTPSHVNKLNIPKIDNISSYGTDKKDSIFVSMVKQKFRELKYDISKSSVKVDKNKLLSYVETLEATKIFSDDANISTYRYDNGTFSLVNNAFVADYLYADPTGDISESHEDGQKISQIKEIMDKFRNSRDTFSQQINEMPLPFPLKILGCIVFLYPFFIIALACTQYLYERVFINQCLENTNLFSNTISALTYFHLALYYTRDSYLMNNGITTLNGLYVGTDYQSYDILVSDLIYKYTNEFMNTLEEINIKTKEVSLTDNYDPFFKDKSVSFYFNSSDSLNFTLQEAVSNIGYEIFLLINSPKKNTEDYKNKLSYVYRNGYNSLFYSLLGLINTFSDDLRNMVGDKNEFHKMIFYISIVFTSLILISCAIILYYLNNYKETYLKFLLEFSTLALVELRGFCERFYSIKQGNNDDNYDINEISEYSELNIDNSNRKTKSYTKKNKQIIIKIIYNSIGILIIESIFIYFYLGISDYVNKIDIFIQNFNSEIRFRALGIGEINFIRESFLQTDIPLYNTKRDNYTLEYFERMFSFSKSLEIVDT